MSALLAASQQGNGGGIAAGVIGGVLAVALYFTPTVVAAVRHVTNLGSVIVINLFLGWSVIGWVIALAMACRSHPPAATQVTVTQINEAPDPPAVTR